MKAESPPIVLVDDEPDMCWILENVLRPAGYAVNTTMSAAKVLEPPPEEPYELALAGAKLADLDGLELAL